MPREIGTGVQSFSKLIEGKGEGQYLHVKQEDNKALMVAYGMEGDSLTFGTFENGTEYTIIATVLNLNKELIRMLQKFDFTKKNPKMVYVNAGEKMISLEDSILIAFLNLIGFDIVLFVPTGYHNVEKYFNENIFEEHQIGEYMYDLSIPNLRIPPTKIGSSILNIFKKG